MHELDYSGLYIRMHCAYLEVVFAQFYDNLYVVHVTTSMQCIFCLLKHTM